MTTTRIGFPWFEFFIILLVISLIFQIWPFLFWRLLWGIDVRNWSWTVIIGANVVVVIALMYIKSFKDS